MPPQPRCIKSVDAVVALCSYEGAGADLVLAIKRRNQRGVLRSIGAALRSELDCPPLTATPAVTWAPTTAQRRRERGFDQAEELARAVTKSSHWRSRRLLKRASSEQMGLSRAERVERPRFEPIGSVRNEQQTVVLVDDVVTTGATASAAAKVLRQAGAKRVLLAVIAVA